MIHTITVETSDGRISAHSGESIDWEINKGALVVETDNRKTVAIYAAGFWQCLKSGQD